MTLAAWLDKKKKNDAMALQLAIPLPPPVLFRQTNPRCKQQKDGKKIITSTQKRDKRQIYAAGHLLHGARMRRSNR